MQNIQRKKIIEQIEEDGGLALVDVLSAEQFAEGHLPRAINIPLGSKFEESVRKIIPDKERPIVVYCASEACDASPRAAHRLEQMGYENVSDYPGGKKDWTDAGLRLV